MRVPVLLIVALACVTALSAASAEDKPGRIALIIGNGTYAAADSALSAATTDARLLADDLRRQHFDIDIKENLGGTDMRRAVDTFIGKIQNGTVALLYFSGYGVQVGGQTFLLPVNAQITTEANVRDVGISLNTTVSDMHRRGAKVKIVIIDAARQNPYEMRFRKEAAGLAAIAAPEGMLAIYSTAIGKLVPSTPGAPSLFMEQLIKALGVSGRSTEDAFNSTRDALARATNYQQVPWVATSLFDQFFLTDEPAATTAKSTPAPAKTPTVATTTTTTTAPAKTTTTTTTSNTTTPSITSPSSTSPAKTTTATTTSPVIQTAKPSTPAATTPAATTPAATTPATITPAKPQQTRVEGSDDPAVIELDQRIKSDSNDLAAYYKRGQLYAQHGSFQRAIQDFDTVIRSNSQDPEALNNRCFSRAVVGELQAALSDCNAAIQAKPRYGDAYDSRGLVHLKSGKPKEAIADYDESLRVNPKQASSLYGRGLAKGKAGNAASGNADILAAKAIQSDIVEEFARYGVH